MPSALGQYHGCFGLQNDPQYGSTLTASEQEIAKIALQPTFEPKIVVDDRRQSIVSRDFGERRFIRTRQRFRLMNVIRFAIQRLPSLPKFCVRSIAWAVGSVWSVAEASADWRGCVRRNLIFRRRPARRY